MIDILTTIGSNKLFIGLAMIVMNIGSRYIVNDITADHEEFLKSSIFKKVVMFCIVFIATRDIMTAIIMTFAFSVVMGGLLNKKSGFYILSFTKPTKLIF
jgi:hypothetical protein